jgi:hypothetical protein
MLICPDQVDVVIRDISGKLLHLAAKLLSFSHNIVESDQTVSSVSGVLRIILSHLHSEYFTVVKKHAEYLDPLVLDSRVSPEEILDVVIILVFHFPTHS